MVLELGQVIRDVAYIIRENPHFPPSELRTLFTNNRGVLAVQVADPQYPAFFTMREEIQGVLKACGVDKELVSTLLEEDRTSPIVGRVVEETRIGHNRPEYSYGARRKRTELVTETIVDNTRSIVSFISRGVYPVRDIALFSAVTDPITTSNTFNHTPNGTEVILGRRGRPAKLMVVTSMVKKPDGPGYITTPRNVQVVEIREGTLVISNMPTKWLSVPEAIIPQAAFKMRYLFIPTGDPSDAKEEVKVKCADTSLNFSFAEAQQRSRLKNIPNSNEPCIPLSDLVN